MRRFGVLILLLAAGITAICYGKPRSKGAVASYFVDLTLGGARLSLLGKDFHYYDSKKGYHLKRQSVPDIYGHVSLALLDKSEEDIGARQVSLPSLRTGRGVNIGDTPKQVRSKLGAPTNIIKPQDSEIGELTYDYEAIITMPRPASNKGKVIKRAYMATYVFHKNRLQSIAYLVTRANS